VSPITFVVPITFDVHRKDGVPMAWYDWLLLGTGILVLAAAPIALAILNHKALQGGRR